MSRMVIRPPAQRVHLLPQQGVLTARQQAMTAVPTTVSPPLRDLARQTFGGVDQFKAYGGAGGGRVALGLMARAFQYIWQDRVQVNPVHEQPKLIFYSGAQPLIRWGLMRRFTRTFMAASPRFQGRWAYVGYQQRLYAERPRLTGNISRLGRTYRLEPPSTGPGPRTIQLGG